MAFRRRWPTINRTGGFSCLFFWGGGVNPAKKLTPKKRKTGKDNIYALWGKYTCFNTGKFFFYWFLFRYHPSPMRLWGLKGNFGTWNLKNAKYHLSRHAWYFRQHLYLLNRYTSVRKYCHKSLALTDGLFFAFTCEAQNFKIFFGNPKASRNWMRRLSD